MVRHTRKLALTLAALAALALGGSALAQAGSQSSKQTKPAATRHVAAKHAKATSTARAQAAQAGTTETPDAAGAADTDTVQSGDQSAPDTETADGTNEAAGSEVPDNDGPGGHADEPGNPSADHQFEGQE
jgi:hypothetical protein